MNTHNRLLNVLLGTSSLQMNIINTTGKSYSLTSYPEKLRKGERPVVEYRSHHKPAGYGPRYWRGWWDLWVYRFGIETGWSELEFFERVICFGVFFVLLGLILFKSWSIIANLLSNQK